jgi:hypothetical protein
VKKAIVLAFLGGAAVVCLAQSHRFPPIDPYAGDPTGNACTGMTIQQSSTTGLLYTCQSGTMKASGSTGSGTVSGQSSGKIPLATGATTIGSQSHLDDGVTTANTITSSVNVAVTGTVAAKNIVRNVLTYGADPTNTTDSSSAFMSCLQAGVGCYVPPGAYKISATIRIPNCSGSNKSVAIWGDPGTLPNGYPAVLNIAAGVTAFAPACPLTAYLTSTYRNLEIKGGLNGIDFGMAGITDIDHVTFWDYSGYAITHIKGEKHTWRDVFCWHQTVVATGCISLNDPTATTDAATYAADGYWGSHNGWIDRVNVERVYDQGNSTTVNDSYFVHAVGSRGGDVGEGIVGNARFIQDLCMWCGTAGIFDIEGDFNIGEINQPVLDIIGSPILTVPNLIYIGGVARFLTIRSFNPYWPPSMYFTNAINIRQGAIATSIINSSLGGSSGTYSGLRLGFQSTGGGAIGLLNTTAYVTQEGSAGAFQFGNFSTTGGSVTSNYNAATFVGTGAGNGTDYMFFLPSTGGVDNCSNWVFARSKPSISNYSLDLSINCTSASLYRPLNLVSSYFNGTTTVSSQWGFTATNTGGAGNNMTLTLAPTNPGTGTSPVVAVNAALTATSVSAGASTPTKIDATGVTYPDGTTQSTTSTLPASAVQVGTNASGVVKSISAWQRQGIAIAPVPTDPSQQVQEASAILDSSPEILSSSTYSQVVKHTFTCGWWPVSLGGAGMNICFGESADGLTNMTRYSGNPIITNHARSYLMSSKVSGNYVLFASDMVASPPHVDMYTGTTIGGLTLAHANVLACGSNGGETNTSIGMGGVFIVSGNHWRGFYDCQLADGQYVTYLADSTNAGVTWTKTSTTPVVGETSAITCGGLCYNGGGMDAHYIGGTLHIWGHWGPNSGVPGVPTPYIWHFSDSSGDPGKHLVADALPAMQSQTTAEGVNAKAGQFADPYLLDMGSLNKTILYATSYTNGCSALAVCTIPAYITASTINQPLTNVLAGVQQDNSQSLGPTLVQVNGSALSRRDVVNIVGSGISDGGNGKIVIPTVDTVTGILGATGGSTTVASDTFVRAAGALGANWTGSSNVAIQSSGAVGDITGGTNDNDWYTGATFTANQCSSITIGTLPPTSGWVATTVRSSASTGYAMLVFVNTPNINAALYKFSGTWVGSLLLNITGVTGAGAMAVGDVYKLCIVGTTLTGYKNGVALSGVTSSDSTFAGPGNPGLGMTSTYSAARISNWSGDNVGINPSVTVTMGGSALTPGCTNAGTVTVTAALTSMVCTISGVGGNPTNVFPQCAVTAANTVTPALCTAVSTTPASQSYNIRVLP